MKRRYAIPRDASGLDLDRLKEESPDKDAAVNMDLDDLYEVIESSPICMRTTTYCSSR